MPGLANRQLLMIITVLAFVAFLAVWLSFQDGFLQAVESPNAPIPTPTMAPTPTIDLSQPETLF
ncbi:MAG: hypothetical protein AAB499_02260 [Patescibacteria group bacterium]